MKLTGIFVIALVLSACKPFLMLPGGALDGVLMPAPADWSALRAIKTIQLETRMSDPYSVNIWVISDGAELYVHAGANRATWVDNMLVDPHVRIQVGDRLYELTSSRVTSQTDFNRFSDLYEQKYDRRPRNENVTEAYLFRLQAPAG